MGYPHFIKPYDGGAWVEEPGLGMNFPGDSGSAGTTVFVGEGAYEGLTLMMHGVGPMGGPLDFQGLIYEGAPPPPFAGSSSE